MLTQERLREVVHYDPATGEFVWIGTRRGWARPGLLAGCVDPRTGYISISVDGQRYRAHRLAWLYVYGVWPQQQIDHINGVTGDNRIANLREATPAQNAWNRTRMAMARSGLRGAVWNKSCRRWQASLKVAGNMLYLGVFDTPEAAHIAYEAARARHHGEFRR